jgi:hypothetical protein
MMSDFDPAGFETLHPVRVIDTMAAIALVKIDFDAVRDSLYLAL